MKILIVDDEELARLRLRRLLEELSEQLPLEVVGEAAHAAAALEWLDRDRCDVLLLDIHMPGLDGIELAARLRARPDAPALIFVTAHTEHALTAFDLEALDYLTKPVRTERLLQALQRVVQHAQAQAGPADAQDAAVIVVSDRGRVHRVPVADVLYFKAELKYVTLRTADHAFVLDDTLTDLERRLDQRFIRVHRNALVARRAVRALERRALDDEDTGGWAVRVAPVDEWLAVSRRQIAAVREALAAEGL